MGHYGTFITLKEHPRIVKPETGKFIDSRIEYRDRSGENYERFTDHY